MPITIVEARPDSAEAMQLIAELDTHLAGQPYPPESRHAFSIDQLVRDQHGRQQPPQHRGRSNQCLGRLVPERRELHRSAAGDPGSWEELMKRYRSRLRRMVSFRLDPPAEILPTRPQLPPGPSVVAGLTRAVGASAMGRR